LEENVKKSQAETTKLQEVIKANEAEKAKLNELLTKFQNEVSELKKNNNDTQTSKADERIIEEVIFLYGTININKIFIHKY